MLSEKLLRAKEIDGNPEFWKMMLTKTNLAEAIRKRFTVGGGSLIVEDTSEDIDNESEDLDEAEM